MKYNIISCKGFGDSSVGFIGSGGCIKARFGIVILFFLLAILNKWVFEMFGMVFNVWLAALGGVFSYMVVISIFGNMKMAFAIGLGAGIVSGIFGGSVFGETGDGE